MACSTWFLQHPFTRLRRKPISSVSWTKEPKHWCRRRTRYLHQEMIQLTSRKWRRGRTASTLPWQTCLNHSQVIQCEWNQQNPKKRSEKRNHHRQSSYVLRTEKGTYHRNRSHLRETRGEPNNFSILSDFTPHTTPFVDDPIQTIPY